MSGPNQTITPGQIIEIILKWHWIIIIPFCISVIIGSVLVVTLPRIYQARTVILIQPQKVPSNIVQDIVSSDINARITTLSQRILSRTNLEKIIDEFKLFNDEESEKLFLEQKVASLEKRISVNVTVTKDRKKEVESFSISFKGTEPEKVMKIANYIAASFIDENLKIRETQVLGTNTFLEDELGTMRKKLIVHEQSLKSYREKYMGGLPEQLNSNLKILGNLNDQLVNVVSGIHNAKERLANLEQFNSSRLSQSTDEDVGSEKRMSLAEMKTQLGSYQERYTEWHPDVIRLKQLIVARENELKQSVGNQADDGSEIKMSSAKDDIDYFKQKNNIKSEFKQFAAEKKELIKQISIYKKRVEDTPKREQELLSLQRDYNNINVAYDSLLGRQLEAQIAVNMEKKQKGEQFRVLDYARVPQRPVSPNTKQLFIFVLAIGFGFGGGIIFLLEFFDTSFREPESLEAFLNIPVIGTIPSVNGAKVRRREIINRILSITGIITAFSLFVVFICLIIIKG